MSSSMLSALPSPDEEKTFSFGAFPVLDTPSKARARYVRQLSDNEVAYFLPSRADGVNDMCIQLRVKAPLRLMHRERGALVWAILRMRHPLLASKIEMHDYDDIRLIYEPPSSPEDAVRDAEEHMGWGFGSMDEVIDSCLNGSRILASDRVSHLSVSRAPAQEPYPSPPQTPSLSSVGQDAFQTAREEKHEFQVLLTALHCLGDGMAMHTMANDFFSMVGGSKSDDELRAYMAAEWKKHVERPMADGNDLLPPCLEDSLPELKGELTRAAARVDYDRVLAKQIGGHTLPRRENPSRHIVIGKHTFDAEMTKSMLKKCKSQNVSFAGAMFAACNISWARMTSREQQALPMMIYSAMNVRPFLRPRPHDSYMFLALGYFNIVLPSFLGQDEAKTFWHRARSVKDQISKAQKTPMLIPRIREMTRRRAAQSRIWGREDDEKAAGTWVPPPPRPVSNTPATPRAPSTVLCGLSMLGNLDTMYTYDAYPDIEVLALNNGPRLRGNGALMFAYTFLGKTSVHFYYDEGAIEPKALTMFWDGMLGAVNEFMA
ncbi:hypothetical protein PENSPDRAFT_7426 [Peniophora sp. CONT]|nr:hypothetical protein PENSPDRAFT_7426 [Peniophora sp. CONT]